MTSKWNKAKFVLEINKIGNYLEEIKNSAMATGCRVIEKGNTVLVAGKSSITAYADVKRFASHWNDNTFVHIIEIV